MAAGRGSTSEVASLDPEEAATVALADHVLDVTAHAQRKMSALAQHRSQYVLTADMFPSSIVTALLGTEYFNRAR